MMSPLSLVENDLASSNEHETNDRSCERLKDHGESRLADNNAHDTSSGYVRKTETLNGWRNGPETRAPSPVAIVGMAMRLPGGIKDARGFWQMLVNKGNGQSKVPEDRYNIESFYSASGKAGTVKSKYGYFLDGCQLQNLDTSFFAMTKAEIDRLDPQQRMLLEVVWECMENAGQVRWRGKNIGCYVGAFGEDWLDLAAKDTQHLGMYRITGSGDFALANRVSYEYDLSGPRSVWSHHSHGGTDALQYDHSNRLFLVLDRAT